MKLVRERPDQRQHHRVTAPLFVAYDGQRIRADDWSLGGLRLSGVTGELPELGSEVDLHISVPFQGFDINFPVKLKVVRDDQELKMFAGKFLDLGERERDLMELFIEDLIRGSMSDARDTIQRIDVPVTPISTKPDVDPGVKAPVSRWSRKTVIMTAFYLLSGIAIFGYLALLIFTNFVRMEIGSAIVSRPVIVSKALADGRIESYAFKAGDEIKKGDKIAELAIPDVQDDIDGAQIDILRHEGALKRAKKALGDGKRFKMNDREIGVLRLKVSKAEDELSASKLELKKLQRALTDHHIIAPFDARIIELRKPAGSTIIYKEPILVLERLGPPRIDAYLTQDQVMKIKLGDEAKFYIPSLRVKASARITTVNRTSSNLDVSASQYFWQDPDAKTALVSLELPEISGIDSWPAGLPATVMFKRHRDKTPVLGQTP